MRLRRCPQAATPASAVAARGLRVDTILADLAESIRSLTVLGGAAAAASGAAAAAASASAAPSGAASRQGKGKGKSRHGSGYHHPNPHAGGGGKDVGRLSAALAEAAEAEAEQLREIKSSRGLCEELRSLLWLEGRVIGDTFLGVEKYVNLNYLAVYKILKKHDKLLPGTPCLAYYMSRLHAQRWIQADNSDLFVQVRCQARMRLCAARDAPLPSRTAGRSALPPLKWIEMNRTSLSLQLFSPGHSRPSPFLCAS